MKRDLRGRKAWRVQIAEHMVERPSRFDPYLVAASESVRFERERVDAIRGAVRDAHIEAGVPPWRPYLRQSVPHVAASETWWNPVDG